MKSKQILPGNFRPKAIGFDLDGTLIDSIPLWTKANIDALKQEGITMREEDFIRDIYQCGLHHSDMLEKCGLSTLNAAHFYAQRNMLFMDLLSTEVTWIGDSERVIKECAATLPIGLMTGSRRNFIAALDARLHLSSLFS